MRKTAAPESASLETTKTIKPKDYFAITLPRISFRNAPLNVYLVAVLVIFAFLLGMLTNKVLYLEQVAKNPPVPTPAPNVQAGITAAPTPPQVVNVAVGHFPPQGNTNAKLKIVEFADLRCPFCKQLFTDSEPQIINDYVKTGKAVFYFRHYAFLGPASIVAANATECANEQNKFWDMENYFYENQPAESDTSMYTVDNLTQVAGTLGMDTTQFQACLSANKYQKDVDTDIAEAQKAQVDGTPTLFINGHRLVGAVPYASIKTVIDQQLQQIK
jgi:protein-disulfide isomerase